MSKAFDSIKRGLRQAIEHAESHAPTPENQCFASVWDALEDTPQEAARMKARSALRMLAEGHAPRHASHDETVVEMLKADPELAKEYLAAALEVAKLPGGQAAVLTALRHIAEAQG